MRKLGFKNKTYLLYDIPEEILNHKKSIRFNFEL